MTVVASLVVDSILGTLRLARLPWVWRLLVEAHTLGPNTILVTRLRTLTNQDAPAVNRFLHRLCRSDWVFGELDTGWRLVESNLRFHQLSAWAGWHGDDLCAMAWVVDEAGDGRTGVMRAIALGGPISSSPLWQAIKASLRGCCGRDFEGLEATPSSGATVDPTQLRRLGFRRASPFGNRLENFLPAIFHHDAAKDCLSQGDLFDGLLAVAPGDDDNAISCRTDTFVYSWNRSRVKMDVRIDWRRRYVAAVSRMDWTAWCVVARELPFEIYYYVKNRTGSSMEFRLGVRSGSSSPTQMIPAGGVRSGRIQIADPPRRLTAGATVDLELAGMPVSFRIRRFRRFFREPPNVAYRSESADCTSTAP